MKKLAFWAAVALLIGLIAPGGHAVAAPPNPQLNWGKELNSNQCPSGQLVINIVHNVVNDADSGMAGNAWASDSYTRQIQVWETAPGTFCALVQYEGAFVTNAGRSPGDTDDIADGIKGTMQGGYRSTLFTGTLNSAPAYPTQGNIGTFDYACDANFNCNYFRWVGTYFSSHSEVGYAWWGWIYRGGTNGTWVNSGNGNFGDITD